MSSTPNRSREVMRNRQTAQIIGEMTEEDEGDPE